MLAGRGTKKWTPKSSEGRTFWIHWQGETRERKAGEQSDVMRQWGRAAEMFLQGLNTNNNKGFWKWWMTTATAVFWREMNASSNRPTTSRWEALNRHHFLRWHHSQLPAREGKGWILLSFLSSQIPLDFSCWFLQNRAVPFPSHYSASLWNRLT